MSEDLNQELLTRAKKFFRENIVSTHLDRSLKKASHLKSYNVNPFLLKYLANFLTGNDEPRSMAQALIYPRILGSSINTSFGMHTQKMIGDLFEGLGSTTTGIDIEFYDQLDGRKKYCQLKSGPNTINYDDVETINGHFNDIKNLARTNNLDVRFNDLIVGVLYGEEEDLSSHYQRISEKYPVFVGQELWHRVTGNEDFYLELIDAIGEVALEVDATDKLNDAIKSLAEEIKTELLED